MAFGARITRGSYVGAYDAYRSVIDRRIEFAALQASDRASQIGKRSIRSAMQSAGLGRLGNAIDANSDLSEGRGVHRTGNGFSASGVVFIRSRSERTRGAIESYTAGAEIRPVRGRWLWIPTDQIPRVTARRSMTPELWRQNGFDTKIGPLVFVRSVNGNPLLVVKNASISAAGKTRSAKSLTKRGMPRKGQAAKEFIVAFIGIPRTARAARINVPVIMAQVQAQLPRLYAEALVD